MTIKEIYEQDYNQEFEDFLNKFNNLLKCVLGGKLSIKSEEFNTDLTELVIMGSVFGLQYGINHKFRRCNSSYLIKTENNINIINLHFSFQNLINGILILQKAIVECKKILLCGHIKLESSLTNIFCSQTWIPGTLTNSQFVLQKYPFGKLLSNNKSLIKNSIPVSVILSLAPKMYEVVSREVLAVLNREIIFDVSKGKKKLHQIYYIGVIDTNINSIEHTNITNVCINSYSRYTKKLISSLLTTLFNYMSKK